MRFKHVPYLSQRMRKKLGAKSLRRAALWPSGSSPFPALPPEGKCVLHSTSCLLVRDWLLSTLQWKLIKTSPKNEV